MNAIQNILLEFMGCVHRILGRSFRKAIVYGSYARGDYHADSDVDVMILTSLSEGEIKSVENAVYDEAFEMEMKYGIHISVIIKNEEHFKYWSDVLPFYRNVEREGVVIDG